MRAATYDLPIDARYPKSESIDTVAVLEELLAQSIQLRDMYKMARWQTADAELATLRQFFDGHYQEQIRLVDVLIDRIRTLNGACRVFAGDFLQRSHFPPLLRGRASNTRLLVDLVDAHERVLSEVTLTPTGDLQAAPSWNRDFAVGQVVLSNDLQLFAVSEQLRHRDGKPRTQADWEC